MASAEPQNIMSGLNLSTQYLSIIVILLSIFQFINFGILFVVYFTLRNKAGPVGPKGPPGPRGPRGS